MTAHAEATDPAGKDPISASVWYGPDGQSDDLVFIVLVLFQGKRLFEGYLDQKTAERLSRRAIVAARQFEQQVSLVEAMALYGGG